jgi:hypothetical protein
MDDPTQKDAMERAEELIVSQARLSFDEHRVAIRRDDLRTILRIVRASAEAITTMQAREATLIRERQWQPIKTAPKDGTPIQLAVRGWSPERPNANGHFVTVGRWSWSPDARLPHEKFPDDGGKNNAGLIQKDLRRVHH